ncbi:MAG: hypothetical protein ACXV2G_00750 [Actinomycetes bacterium]
MSWCWLARLDRPPEGAWAWAALARDGVPAGVLAAWPAGRKPVADAVRMDARLVDPSGTAAAISLVLLPRDRSPLFDDPSVSGALRRVLAAPPPDGVSTFVRDSSHFAGAVTVRRETRLLLRDDPFARVGHADMFDLGAGLFGRVSPVPGPVTQRYAGQPWPVAGF